MIGGTSIGDVLGAMYLISISPLSPPFFAGGVTVRDSDDDVMFPRKKSGIFCFFSALARPFEAQLQGLGDRAF